MKKTLALAAALSLTLAGCGGALDPGGSGAAGIADLGWLMFWLSLIPIAIVSLMLVRIVLRRRHDRSGDERPAPDLEPGGRSDRRMILLGGVALPIVLLIPVAIVGIITASNRVSADEGTLEIGITGHQYWWDVTYPMPGSDRLDDAETFRTANEIHIPVGEPVELRLESEDVIHSFWVPELDGKMDLIPGRVNRLTIEADRPGVFHGVCAEFCGLGHTDMRIIVVALEDEAFDQWLEHESGPAVDGLDPDTVQEYADSCGVCHDLRGVYEERSFRGDFGPDLTHLASRRSIGAGLMSMTPEALGRWIVDPHGVKPGNRMPPFYLDGDELADMVELLEQLE